MESDITQIIASFVLLLWIDFIFLTLVRALRLPDFLGHVVTGIVYSTVFFSPVDWFPSNHGNPSFNLPDIIYFLAQAGLFFFFLEFGFKLPLKTPDSEASANYRDLILYSLLILLFFSLSLSLISPGKVSPVTILYIPIAFLAADMSGLVMAGHSNLDRLRSRYLNFIRFSLNLEVVALIAFFLLLVTHFFSIQDIELYEFVLFIVSLVWLWFLSGSKFEPFRTRTQDRKALFLILVGVIIWIPVFILEIQLSVIIAGFVSGVILQFLARWNRITPEAVPLKVFRFFMIFPILVCGFLFQNPLNWFVVCLNLVVLLLALVLAALIMGMYWALKDEDFFIPSAALLFRGEFTLFLILWGYFQQIVSTELVVSLVFLIGLMQIVGRLSPLQKWI
ncbi:MAG: hypothetical protein Kow0042_13750 [Calditrichia bacterium]